MWWEDILTPSLKSLDAASLPFSHEGVLNMNKAFDVDGGHHCEHVHLILMDEPSYTFHSTIFWLDGPALHDLGSVIG